MPSTSSASTAITTSTTATTAEILLEIAQKNYADETARTSTLDAKIGISLPLISGYFLAILTSLGDWPKFFKLPASSVAEAIIPMVTVLALAGALVLSLVALYLMISTISTKEYQHVDVHEFYTLNLFSVPTLPVIKYLLGKYLDATDHNKLQNDQRVAPYRRGWVLVIISIGLFLLYNILKPLI